MATPGFPFLRQAHQSLLPVELLEEIQALVAEMEQAKMPAMVALAALATSAEAAEVADSTRAEAEEPEPQSLAAAAGEAKASIPSLTLRLLSTLLEEEMVTLQCALLALQLHWHQLLHHRHLMYVLVEAH